MEKQSVVSLQKKKKAKIPLVALTCYDAFTAVLVDAAGADIALVGDSLANTRLGYPNTLPVTMEEMLHHVKAASRGNRSALLVADMPFQSYETAPWQAAQAAGRFIKEGGADAVKVEGGTRISPSIVAMLNANIPVMGHLGLTPQSLRKEGGYRVQAREPRQARALLAEARVLQKLGVFALVLEGIPAAVARRVTRALSIPTIGIGAGPDCDGQILVFDDVLGLTEGPVPQFVKPYESLRRRMKKALSAYAADVRARRFPDARRSYK